MSDRIVSLSRLVPILVCLAAGGGAMAEPAPLAALLEPIRARYELPALAAAVVIDGEIVAAGAVGTRRAGEDLPVTLQDRFHLGSDTKAMTSLLAATLVEEGKLRWDTTVGEAFPELAAQMDGGLRAVTLQQLLSHIGGIPSDDAAFGELLEKSLAQDGNLDELRYWLVREWSRRPLASEPGTTFAYSNMGYTLAGAMIERAGGKTWEELVTERVFTPLGLRTAGLGPQSSPGKVDAPLGHLLVDGKPKAFLAGPNGDNPPIIGPAGVAHMSVLDFARWAGWNAGEGKRGPAIVKPETLRKVHARVISIPDKEDAAPGTPAHGGYALGWGEVTMPWAPEPLLHHGGSNQKNLAHIWAQPAHDFAMVVVTNIAGPTADEALRSVAAALYAKFGPAKKAFAILPDPAPSVGEAAPRRRL